MGAGGSPAGTARSRTNVASLGRAVGGSRPSARERAESPGARRERPPEPPARGGGGIAEGHEGPRVARVLSRSGGISRSAEGLPAGTARSHPRGTARSRSPAGTARSRPPGAPAAGSTAPVRRQPPRTRLAPHAAFAAPRPAAALLERTESGAGPQRDRPPPPARGVPVAAPLAREARCQPAPRLPCERRTRLPPVASESRTDRPEQAPPERREPDAPVRTRPSLLRRHPAPPTPQAISPAPIASASTASGSAPSSTRRSTRVVATTTTNATATDRPANT